MKISSSLYFLICLAALSSGIVAEDKTSASPKQTTAKGPAEGLKSTRISEFQCKEEPLDSVLARLSKTSGLELKLNRGGFKNRPIPTVTLPMLKGARFDDVLNMVAAVSATQWLVVGSRVEVSAQ